MNGAKRFTQSSLYALKRAYPGEVILSRNIDPRLDVLTGRKLVDIESIRVLRAVILPARADREFAYDLAFIAAAKNFTYGGQYDTNTRRIIIDRRDIPPTFIPTIGDFAVYDGERYEIKEVHEFERRSAYLLWIKQLAGPVRNAVYPMTVRTTLHVADEAAANEDMDAHASYQGSQLVLGQALVATVEYVRGIDSRINFVEGGEPRD